MSTRVTIEEIETTREEKLLAVVLAVFLFLGGVWGYERMDNWIHDRALVVFLARLALDVAALAASLWLTVRLSRRRSRYLPAALAGVGASTVLGFVLAVDYLSDYVSWEHTGPLVVSVIGAGLTLVALAALQRYVARRTPARRVRRRLCPFCGFPVADTDHCEGCGREVRAPCSTCGSTRRVGTARCGACGAA